ncbi:MAG: LPS biosynthesis protein WbpP, partial [Pirellulales bacterium]|nr:LPS biosynthesis protein WbpP [Pirellulales bacterium]
TYVENVVRANLAAAERPAAAGRVFNAACGRKYSLLELVASINRVLRTNLKPEFAPPRTVDVLESLADITAAREVLGYEPTIEFEKGLERSIAYYRTLA